MQSIPELVRHRLLVWAREHDEKRLVIIRNTQQELRLPASVRATPYRLRGNRRAAKGPRFYRDLATVAYWPKDNLSSKNTAQIVCVIRGQADLCFGQYSLRVPEGLFILIPPDMPHPMGRGIPHLSAAAQAGHEHCDLLWFSRWGGSIRCWMCHSRGTKHNHNMSEHFYVSGSRLLAAFDLLAEEMQENEPNSPSICASLLPPFFFILEREFRRGYFIHPGFSTATEDEKLEGVLEESDPIERTLHYVKSHLSENLTIEEAARKAYLSRSLFTQRFRQQTGRSFRQYVTEARIEEAKHLLQNSRLAISLIPHYVGLSPSRFFDLFRQQTGQTPAEFRAGSQSTQKFSHLRTHLSDIGV
jgi:AraC-like DNA-binding protein